MDSLCIGFLGGVPRTLGAGGLELQMDRTAAALGRIGHHVVRVECAPDDVGLDVLHAFHAEPAVWHLLPHWTRNRCPLVVSPVLPIQPGRDERLLKLSAHFPLITSTARMRRDVMTKADAVVALTAYEARVTQRVFGADPARVRVIGNGVDPLDGRAGALPDRVPEGRFVLMVGSVSRRKRQVEVARALASRVPLVVVGAITGQGAERVSLERDLTATGAIWLGEIPDPAMVRALQRSASALALFSSAEAQPLAVLESLSVGTPVVASDLPAHRELLAAYPGWLSLVDEPGAVLPAFERLTDAERGPAPSVPSWDDVAERLVEVYQQVTDG